MLESEYRLCRDFPRGKQLSAEQLARLRSSGFLEQPLCPADIEARPPDYVPQLMNGAYVADMFAGYKGKAAKVTLTQDYLDDFSQLADFDTLNYSLVFLDDDGNLFFYASCQPGQDMTCLYLSK